MLLRKCGELCVIRSRNPPTSTCLGYPATPPCSRQVAAPHVSLRRTSALVRNAPMMRFKKKKREKKSPQFHRCMGLVWKLVVYRDRPRMVDNSTINMSTLCLLDLAHLPDETNKSLTSSSLGKWFEQIYLVWIMFKFHGWLNRAALC